jgi:Tfp pilus assembly protein PilF
MYREAAETFSKGLQADPKHSSSYYGLGQAYEGLGEPQKARETYLKGIEAASEQGDVMPQRKMESRLRQLS